MVDEHTATGIPRAQDYPVAFFVDYPERLSRVSTAFRLILVIPILVVLAVLVEPDAFDTGGLTARFAVRPYFDVTVPSVMPFASVLILAPALMILFRQKYPRWWFDWNLQVLRFNNRINVYLLLLRDEYPSTDEEQAVRLDMRYPDAAQLNRWLPLVKWLLAIPHLIVLFFLTIGAIFAAIFAWFAIVFTGRYPRGFFDYVEGVMRWHLRVQAYAFILVTDQYPPFRLRP